MEMFQNLKSKIYSFIKFVVQRPQPTKPISLIHTATKMARQAQNAHIYQVTQSRGLTKVH